MTVSIDPIGTALPSSEGRLQVSVHTARSAGSEARQVSVSEPSVSGASDTVELSVSAHIQLLVREGVSVGEIANTLGLTAALVNSYLFVPVATASVASGSIA